MWNPLLPLKTMPSPAVGAPESWTEQGVQFDWTPEGGGRLVVTRIPGRPLPYVMNCPSAWAARVQTPTLVRLFFAGQLPFEGMFKVPTLPLDIPGGGGVVVGMYKGLPAERSPRRVVVMLKGEGRIRGPVVFLTNDDGNVFPISATSKHAQGAKLSKSNQKAVDAAKKAEQEAASSPPDPLRSAEHEPIRLGKPKPSDAKIFRAEWLKKNADMTVHSLRSALYSLRKDRDREMQLSVITPKQAHSEAVLRHLLGPGGVDGPLATWADAKRENLDALVTFKLLSHDEGFQKDLESAMQNKGLSERWAMPHWDRLPEKERKARREALESIGAVRFEDGQVKEGRKSTHEMRQQLQSAIAADIATRDALGVYEFDAKTIAKHPLGHLVKDMGSIEASVRSLAPLGYRLGYLAGAERAIRGDSGMYKGALAPRMGRPIVAMLKGKGRERIRGPVAFLTDKSDGHVFPVSPTDPKARQALDSPRHREIVKKIIAGTKDPAKRAKHTQHLESLAESRGGGSSGPSKEGGEEAMSKGLLREDEVRAAAEAVHPSPRQRTRILVKMIHDQTQDPERKAAHAARLASYGPALDLPPGRQRTQHPFVGSMKFQGIPIAIENEKGTYREGVDSDGRPWRVKMGHHYGEIHGLGTVGVDGDKLDVYVGPNEDATHAYVIDQMDPVTGAFDEQKVMLGFDSEAAAKTAYRAQYNRPGFYGGCHPIPMAEFKKMVRDKGRRGHVLSSRPIVMLKGKGRDRIKGPVAFLTSKEDGHVFPVSTSDPKARAALASPRHREIVEKIHAGTKDPEKKAKHAAHLGAISKASEPPEVGHLVMNSNQRRFIEAAPDAYKAGDAVKIRGVPHKIHGTGTPFTRSGGTRPLEPGEKMFIREQEGRRSSGHPSDGYAIGQMIHNAKDGKWYRVVSAASNYVTEGRSFGHDMDSGWAHRAIARPATDEEAAPYQAREAKRAEKRQATADLTSLHRDLVKAPGAVEVPFAPDQDRETQHRARVVETGKHERLELPKAGRYTPGAARGPHMEFRIGPETITSYHGGHYDDYREMANQVQRTPELEKRIRDLHKAATSEIDEKVPALPPVKERPFNQSATIARHYLDPVVEQPKPAAQGTTPTPSTRSTPHDDTLMGFGKHANKTWKTVAQQDPSYIRWAAENLSSPGLRSKARAVHETHVLKKGATPITVLFKGSRLVHP